MDIPAVASVHTRFETYFRYYGLAFLEPVMEAILRRFYRRCDAIFAPSEFDGPAAPRAADELQCRDLDARHRPRDLQSRTGATSAWRRGLGIGDDEPVIGFVGRLVMEKGLDVFAETIDWLERRQVRHKVLVVGEGPAQDWFERRLPDAVFAGFQDGPDLGRAVASMDVLFNPSVTETFGNVTLEAMAAGLPVVAAIATGSQSLVDDGVTGRLVRAGAIDGFAAALEAYCRDPERRAVGRPGGLRGEPALRLGRGQPGAGRRLFAGHPPAPGRRQAAGGEPGAVTPHRAGPFVAPPLAPAGRRDMSRRQSATGGFE